MDNADSDQQPFDGIGISYDALLNDPVVNPIDVDSNGFLPAPSQGSFPDDVATEMDPSSGGLKRPRVEGHHRAVSEDTVLVVPEYDVILGGHDTRPTEATPVYRELRQKLARRKLSDEEIAELKTIVHDKLKEAFNDQSLPAPSFWAFESSKKHAFDPSSRDRRGIRDKSDGKLYARVLDESIRADVLQAKKKKSKSTEHMVPAVPQSLNQVALQCIERAQAWSLGDGRKAPYVASFQDDMSRLVNWVADSQVKQRGYHEQAVQSKQPKDMFRLAGFAHMYQLHADHLEPILSDLAIHLLGDMMNRFSEHHDEDGIGNGGFDQGSSGDNGWSSEQGSAGGGNPDFDSDAGPSPGGPSSLGFGPLNSQGFSGGFSAWKYSASKPGIKEEPSDESSEDEEEGNGSDGEAPAAALSVVSSSVQSMPAHDNKTPAATSPQHQKGEQDITPVVSETTVDDLTTNFASFVNVEDKTSVAESVSVAPSAASSDVQELEAEVKRLHAARTREAKAHTMELAMLRSQVKKLQQQQQQQQQAESDYTMVPTSASQAYAMSREERMHNPSSLTFKDGSRSFGETSREDRPREDSFHDGGSSLSSRDGTVDSRRRGSILKWMKKASN